MSTAANSNYKELRGLLSNNGLITIKAYYKTTIKRVPILNPELTYDELCLMIKRILKLSTDEFTLQYKDDEGDWIQLTDDVDVVHAASISSVLSIRIVDTIATSNTAEMTLNQLKQRVSEAIVQLNSVVESLNTLEIVKGLEPESSKKPEVGKKKAAQQEIKPLSSLDVQDFLEPKATKANVPVESVPAVQPASPTPQPQPVPPKSATPPPPRQQSQPPPSQQQPPQYPQYPQNQQGHPQSQPMPAGYYNQGYPGGYQQQRPVQMPYVGYPPSPTSLAFPPNAPPPNSGYNPASGQYQSQSSSTSSLQPLPPNLSQGLQMPKI